MGERTSPTMNLRRCSGLPHNRPAPSLPIPQIRRLSLGQPSCSLSFTQLVRGLTLKPRSRKESWCCQPTLSAFQRAGCCPSPPPTLPKVQR